MASEERQYKISIIIPCYNVADYIEEAIDSILVQTIGQEDLEIIIIDDASTDKTLEIVKRRYAMYENIVIVTGEKSSGAAGKPRNIGIDLAKGKYMMFLDPDDIFTLDACKVLWETIEKQKSDIVIGAYEQFDERKTYMHPVVKKMKQPISKLQIKDRIQFMQLPPSIWCKIYRTDFIKAHQITFPEGIACQDAVFMTACYLKANHIAYVPKVVYRYRLRSTSITNNIKEKYFKDFNISRKLILDLYKANQEFDLSYEQIRYEEDLKFLFKKMKQGRNIDLEGLLKELRWFILLGDQQEIKTSSMKFMIEKAKEENYGEMIDYLYTHEVEEQTLKIIIKSRLKKLLRF